MIIVRYGDTYNTAYVFPRAQEVDTLRYERPPIVARVSGLPGVFDYWGDNNYPYLPFTLRKSFMVTGATYAAVQTALDALKNATIDNTTESKLWFLRRDRAGEGFTHYAWAKCTSLKISDQSGQIYFVQADVEFYVREGVFHHL